MKNRLNSPKNLMAGLAIFAGIAGTTKDSLAQNLTANSAKPTQTENVISNYTRASLNIPADSPLGKIRTELKNYPKELQDHFENIIVLMQNEYEITGVDQSKVLNNILEQEVVTKIKDSEEQFYRSFVAIEETFAQRKTKPIFSNRLDQSDINYDRDNFTFVQNATKEYKKRRKDIYSPILEENMGETQRRIKDKEANIKDKEANIKDKEANIKDKEANIKQLEKDIEMIQKNIEQLQKNIKQLQKNIEQSKKNSEQSKKNSEQSKKNSEQSKKNSEQINKDIEKLNEIIKKEAEKFKKRLERTETEIIAGNISTEEIKGLRNTILKQAENTKIDLKKYPNLRKKIQETQK